MITKYPEWVEEAQLKIIDERIEKMANNEYNCTKVRVKDKNGKEFDVLYDKSRQLLFFDCMTVEFATHMYGLEFIDESVVKE